MTSAREPLAWHDRPWPTMLLGAIARTLGFALMGALAAVALVAASTRVAAASSGCQLVVLAEWPVQIRRELPVADGSINGQPVLVLLDTGGMNSISRPAALKLGLTLQTDPRRVAIGSGGQSRIDYTSVHELRVGNVVNRRMVIDVTGEHDFDWTMMLGKDFFQNYDVEFDLPNRKVQIMRIQGCTEDQLLGWAGQNTGQVPMEPRMSAGTAVVVPVRINGQSFRALLDSGAATSLLRTQAARQLGFTSETPGVAPGGCRTGVGANRYDGWIASFRDFAIDNEVIRNPTLHFGDMTRDHPFPDKSDIPDMLLGADFFRTHRVLIAYSQRKVYFAYAGGTVFPGRKGRPCAEIPVQ